MVRCGMGQRTLQKMIGSDLIICVYTVAYLWERRLTAGKFFCLCSDDLSMQRQVWLSLIY
jgi:hypothetical protein